MEKGKYLTAILRSPKTVFTYKDILLLWGEPGSDAAMVRLHKYARNGELHRIRRGLYAKDKNYDKLEMATRIYVPSYVSFETVLSREGVIFQFYNPIFIASYLTREIIVDGQRCSYKKIKTSVLADPAGVEHKGQSSFATRERAFLDTLYLNTDPYFDNLRGLDWKRVFEILPIYRNKRMEKKVEAYHKQGTEPDG
jgi:hypothetical protein